MLLGILLLPSGQLMDSLSVHKPLDSNSKQRT